MKMKLALFTFVLLLCSVLTLGTGRADASKMRVFSFSCMPNFDASMSGLDARDENNNSLNSVSSQQGLESVFCAGLYDLLVTAEIFSFAQAFELLQHEVNPSSSAFSNNILFVLSGIISAVAPSTKKLLSNAIARLNGDLYRPLVSLLPAVSSVLTFSTPSLTVSCLRC